MWPTLVVFLVNPYPTVMLYVCNVEIGQFGHSAAEPIQHTYNRKQYKMLEERWIFWHGSWISLLRPINKKFHISETNFMPLSQLVLYYIVHSHQHWYSTNQLVNLHILCFIYYPVLITLSLCLIRKIETWPTYSFLSSGGTSTVDLACVFIYLSIVLS